MTPVVFLGPTLPRDEARAILAADWRPPAGCGDVYRAVRDGARTLALIDGAFQSRPAVWHKELLWALAQGVTVCGAASMGALRAAELDGFGMRGIGRIYRGFARARFALEPEARDDAVAVLHAPEELGYAPLTEALVDMRATVRRALRCGVVDGAAAASILETCQSLHFADRTWPTALEKARQGGAAPAPLSRFRAWLPAGGFSQKALDARVLLRWLANGRLAPCDRPPTFIDTTRWRALQVRLENPVLRDC